MKDRMEKWNTIILIMLLIISAGLRFNLNDAGLNSFLDLSTVILLFTIMNSFFKNIVVRIKEKEKQNEKEIT